MKDPTRGGLADALNEWTEKSKVGILIQEDKVPIRQDVQTACEMLGLDPLEVGNEGKIIIGVVPEKAEEALKFLKQTAEGKDAQIIGEATTRIQRRRNANVGWWQKNNCKTSRRPCAKNLLSLSGNVFCPDTAGAFAADHACADGFCWGAGFQEHWAFFGLDFSDDYEVAFASRRMSLPCLT